MEGFKDVIVSQPPAMYGKSAYTTAISLENYKGILLCDRPTGLASSSAGGEGSGAVSSKSFAPANPTGNPVGLGPSVETMAQRAQREAIRLENLRKHRTQSHKVLTRHRRWLHSFARQVKQMQSAEREGAVEAARRAAQLRQQQQQQRAVAAATTRCPDCGCCSRVGGVCQQQPREQQQQQHTKSAQRKAAGSKKPKWAMTEDEALEDELATHDDLLAFANSLDYDKFVSDCEVAEALTIMRERLEEVAKANQWSGDDLLLAAHHEADDDLASTVAASDVAALSKQQHLLLSSQAQGSHHGVTTAAEARAAAPGAAAQHDKAWDSSRGRVLKRAISKDALALAERMLAASPSMQRVYTKQSLARMLQRCALEGDMAVSEARLIAAAAAGNARGIGAASAPATAASIDLATATALGGMAPGSEPKVVHVHPEAMAAVDEANPYTQPRVLREMQQSKERTQGLPYLYRCPAI